MFFWPFLQLGRVKQGYGIAQFGAAVQALETVLGHSGVFYNMLADSPVYRALPATKYTDDASQHVSGLGDLPGLARLCGRMWGYG